MDTNEDEPNDVKNATSVASAILNGNKDEKKESIKTKKPKSGSPTFSNREESSNKGRRCNSYKGKFPPPVITKTKKPCHPKTEIICRENLSKNDYIDVLATPKKSPGSLCREVKFEEETSSNKRLASGRKPSCKEKRVLPRLMSNRLKELAKPRPSHVIDLLQTWGSRLRPEIIDSVQKSLEENCTMTPEQMEAYYNEKDGEDCGRVRRVRRKKKCPSDKEKKKSTCNEHMDPQAVCEEYEMAQRFMRHIISHLKNCPFALRDHYDLTEVILSQLGSVLDYRPSGDGDRKFQMMFMLANGIACWVHGLNIAVDEKVAKQQAEDAKEELEAEGSEDEDEEDEEQNEELTEGNEEKEEEEEEEDLDEDEVEVDVKDEKEEKDEETKEDEEEEDMDVQTEPIKDELATETNDDAKDGDDEVQPEEENEVVETDDETNVEVESENEDFNQENDEAKESEEPFEEKEDLEPDTEISEMEDEFMNEDDLYEEKETEDETEQEITPEYEETIEDIFPTESPVDPGLAIEGLGEGDLFASEIPFVTFGMIMQIVVKFLEKFEEAETSEVRRRLQNAILKKLTKLIIAEAPDSLDNNMKAVLEVLAENVAAFMEGTLPKSKVNDVQTMTPEIESTEVRDWGHWLETIMDNATNWGKWIHEKVSEAEEKAGAKVTRGDWQDWTNTVNRDALRWRMFNLDTKHRMHHADLNLTHKKVVHRGGMKSGNVIGSAAMAPYQETDETEIDAYDFADGEYERTEN